MFKVFQGELFPSFFASGITNLILSPTLYLCVCARAQAWECMHVWCVNACLSIPFWPSNCTDLIKIELGSVECNYWLRYRQKYKTVKQQPKQHTQHRQNVATTHSRPTYLLSPPKWRQFKKKEVTSQPPIHCLSTLKNVNICKSKFYCLAPRRPLPFGLFSSLLA